MFPKWVGSVERFHFPGTVLGAIWGGAILSHFWHSGFADNYDREYRTHFFTRLETSFPPGTKICVLDYRPYPCFGSDRSFRVCEPFRLKTLDDLRKYCSATGAGLVVVHSPESLVRGRYQRMHDHVDNSDEAFELIEKGAWFDCYRIRNRKRIRSRVLPTDPAENSRRV